MSVIDDLNKKVQRLEDQLEKAQESLDVAMLKSEPIKVGDFVEVERWKEKHIGRVRRVYVEYGSVRFNVAPKTKSGFHARTDIGYGKVRKLSEQEIIERKLA